MAAREEVLANVLHTLSSKTISPLRLGNNGSAFVPSSENENKEMSGCDWLNQLVAHLRLTATDDSVVNQVMKSMVVESGTTSNDEKLIWVAGLQLVHDIVNNNAKNMSDEPMEPHILLSTLIDSYYYCDDNGGLETTSSIESEASGTSSTIAMFQLRSILATIAIEHSIKVTQDAIEKSATIRWRRLRSMIDDVTSLFRKMLINQLGSALDCESTHASQLITAIATNIYVKQTFPACRELIEMLLHNGTTDAAFTTRVLQTSYSCYGLLTSLAALQFVFGEKDSDDRMHLIIDCMRNSKTDSIFKLMLSKQQAVTGSGIIQNKTRFCLWDSIATYKCERGSDFLRDLLLYPCIRATHSFYTSVIDNSDDNEKDDDDSDESSEEEEQQDEYDSLGIAAIAYTLLENGDEHSWAFLFPHVHIFLSGMNSMSSTLNDLGRYDLNETKAIVTGLVMLDKLMPNTAENIEQFRLTGDESSVACCTMTLGATIESLLSTVIRLSMVESSIQNNPNAMPLKFSSRQVMTMAQKLLHFYHPIIRVQTLGSLAEKMRHNEQSKVLLPRVLDWIRPVIMSSMHLRDPNDALSISQHDTVIVIVAITDALSPLMQELEFAFDKSKPPLPNHLSDFMSMAESYTSLLSVFRSIRMWVKHIESSAVNLIHNNYNDYYQIVNWTCQKEAMLKDFTVLLSDLLDFWSRACSPRDAKVYVGENMEPPIGWHRLFLLLHSLKEI